MLLEHDLDDLLDRYAGLFLIGRRIVGERLEHLSLLRERDRRISADADQRADLPLAGREDLVGQARKKLHDKMVDLIVANDVSRSDAGFEADANEVTMVSADAEEAVPLQSKSAVAERILDRIEAMLRTRTPALT